MTKNAMVQLGALTPRDVIEQTSLVQQVMQAVMNKDEHYGKIPGCGDKPTLLKPGAEKLAFLFRLAPNFTITMRSFEGEHREYEILTELVHIESGDVWGQGVGLCSTMESKYRYRNQMADLACPECGFELRRSNRETEWYCWKAKGGCGANYPLDQFKVSTEKVENPNIADSYNTVLKIAKKRSLVDAVLTATAASDIFTQDIEDLQAAATSFPEATPEPVQGKVIEENENELKQLTHELQSVMIEIDATRDPPVGIESMSTEDFAKLIIEKKNHGNPLTKLVLGDILKEEKAKAAKIRQIAHTKKKPEPTLRTDHFLALVDYVSNQAKMSLDDVEPHVLSWLEQKKWTKLSLNKPSVSDEIWKAVKTIDWTALRGQQAIPA